MMLEDNSLDESDIVRLDSLHCGQRDRLQPVLAFAIRRPDVNVRWLSSFMGTRG